MSDNSHDLSKHADFKVAFGALICIVLGASVSYWIVRAHKKHDIAIPAASKIETNDPTPLSFTTLSSFMYDIPTGGDSSERPTRRDQIPAPIKAFNRKTIAIQGFMVPIDLKNGKTTRFLLVKDQSLCCHFGRIPQMNEWISVRMKPNAAAHVIMDQPVTVFGVLEVGELVDHGEILSIYRMEAEDVAGPLDL